MFRRILSLLAVTSIVGGIWYFVQFPKTEVGQISVSQDVTVQPKRPALICPGPAFINGGSNGVTLGSFTQSGKVSIAGKDGSQSLSLTTSTDYTLKGSVSGSRNFNAIQTQEADNKNVFGLSATNCVSGANEAWLVAGDNSVGREALLILANPTLVDATVSLQLYGTSGPIKGSGLSGISAPAGKLTVLPLASFAPKAATFAVQVSSRGAELGIWLQQKTVRGLTPGGLDLVSASSSPAKTVDIPGLAIRGTDALATLISSGKDSEDAKPVLRVTAPGDKTANFTAQVQGADGSSFGTVIQGTVPGGSTRDFELADLTDGNYSVHIDSDVAVVAAARYSRISGSTFDFAWAASVGASILDAGFTTSKGLSSSLSVTNPNSQPAEITLNGKTHSVEGNSNLVISLSAGESYSLRSKLPVSASQVIAYKGGVAVSPILDYRGVGGQIKIDVR